MDEQKKTLGRSRIYSGSQPEEESQGRRTDRENPPLEGRRSRRAQTIGTVPRERLTEAPSGRRRRDEETEFKMRVLWILLGILVVLLIIAIVFEVILGYGSRETGSERMGAAAEQTETETLSWTESEPEQESESVEGGLTGDSSVTAEDDASENSSVTAEDDASEDSSVT
ncbi:MAG: hypothetical protein LIP12_03990, partial [Clostridiales bacterium]|nr:hypothetical protein [Clostridiales bacterium]